MSLDTWVAAGVVLAVGLVLLGALVVEFAKVWSAMEYERFYLVDAKGNELPDGSRSCARCPTHLCDCPHELGQRLRRGRKGQKLYGVPVGGAAPVLLRQNDRDYEGGDR